LDAACTSGLRWLVLSGTGFCAVTHGQRLNPFRYTRGKKIRRSKVFLDSFWVQLRDSLKTPKKWQKFSFIFLHNGPNQRGEKMISEMKLEFIHINP